MKINLPKAGLLTYALMFLFNLNLLTQPPCLPLAGGIPAGNNAPGCSLCGPVYQGSTAGYGPSAPGSAGFPCGTIENNQFISIVADAGGTLSATILATNCLNGQGVQLIIYDENFNPVSNCFSPPATGSVPGNVSASGLTPGETYWIMIDGFSGDICDILLTVSGGNQTFPPDPPGPITADPDTTPLCPGAIVCYSIDDVNGATEYEWAIPGNAVPISGGGPNDTEVCIEYVSAGGGVIRVTPSNPCFGGVPAIEPVVVVPILPTLKPPESVCLNDFPITRDGIVFTEHGNHEICYQTALGCDSCVNYIFIPIPIIPEILDITICKGECVMVGFNCYDEPITQTITLGSPFQTVDGCDSLVILTINLIEPVADIATPDSISCEPGETVILDGSGSSAGAGVSYLWETSNGGLLAGSSNTNYTSAAAPGTYILTVEIPDSSGGFCIARDTTEVIQKPNVIDSPVFSQPITSLCEGTVVTYSVSPVTGAVSDQYEWNLPPGATIVGADNESTIVIDFTGAQSGQLCVIARGICGESAPACIPINVNLTPTSDFTVTPVICQTDQATVTYTGTGSPFATYNWNFNGGVPANVSGVGPHEVSWDSPGNRTITLQVEENGCSGQIQSQNIQVTPTLEAPVISCNSTQSSVTFSWNDVPNASEYYITVNGDSLTTQTTTTIIIDDLTPNEAVSISVTANGSTICPGVTATELCVAQNCDDITLNIDSVGNICRDATTGAIQLTANPLGGAGGGSLIWSGPGISSSGIFNPLDANIGTNVIALQYSEGTCTYTETIEINVYTTPDAEFTVTTPICEGESIFAAYIGSASTDADFIWNFGNGQILNGTGAGPFEVICPTGLSDINLTVVENGCTSPSITQIVVVDPPLDLPILNCVSSSSTEVVMSWNTIANADSYTVNAAGGQIDLDAQTITFSNLSPGDEVTAEVIAESGNSCPSSRASHTCVAEDCKSLDIDIPPIGPFCDNGSNSIINLSATAGDNSGTFTWSGPGVSQPNIFDPNSSAVNPGVLTVRVSYQKDNCTWTASTDVEIIKLPSADFKIDGPICIEESGEAIYTSDADASAAVFNWNFGNGNNVNGTSGIGPYQIDWNDTGIQTVSLSVEENGCISETTFVNVQVDDALLPPTISCISEQNSIDFSWLPVSGALQYDAFISYTNIPGLSDNFIGPLAYNFSNLSPGDSIEITTVATGSTVCDPVQSTLICATKDCPDFDIIMPNITPICTYGNEPGFELTDSMSITNSAGQSLIGAAGLLWHDGNNSNDYITPGGRFFPSSAASFFGVGDVPIAVDIEYPIGTGCIQTFSSTIRLNPIPNNSLLLPTQICITEAPEVILAQAVNDSDADFDWNFGNANVLSGSAGGPYELSWDTDQASDTITVQITEHGCISDIIAATIKVNETLNPLDANLRCNVDNTTNSFVEFNWDNIPTATDYDIAVLTAGFPAPTINSSSVTFDNLNPRDEIEIELTVSDINSACPPVKITQTCTAIACPPTVVTIEPVSDNCLPTTGNAATQLITTLTDDPTNGAGNFTFSGDQVSADGMFTPDSEGTYTVSVSYISDGCSYMASTDIEMWATPEADFTVTPIICVTDAAIIEFTGTAPPDAVFSWDFDGATGANFNDAAPNPISWTDLDLGIQNITLNMENHGCRAAFAENQVQVDPELKPLNIECAGATTTGLDFTWDSDINVSEYDISIQIDGNGFSPQGTRNQNSFSITNLIPDAQSLIEIEVTATGNTECGPITERQVCQIKPCPDIKVLIDAVSPLCIDSKAQSISYSLDNSGGGLGTGDYELIGQGLNGSGLFIPSIAGVGIHTVTVKYSEQNCNYEANLELSVIALPSVEAGETQILTCNELEAEVGSLTNSPDLDYAWFFGGSQISTEQIIYVDEGGEYTLEVTDPQTGCSNSDKVLVDAEFSNPVVSAELTQITCFNRKDGVITITGMENGKPPYLYSFNGSAFSSQTVYTGLSEGSYSIVGRDANGCEHEIMYQVTEPSEMTVEIVITAGENPVPFGDSLQLEAITNYAPDLLSSISWTPVESFPLCDETNITNCMSHWVTPTGQTVYSVRIENLNGCIADDRISVIGTKDHPIFIPSGFSPRDKNGKNDIFGIYGSSDVIAQIRTFKIFNRWGEQVYENYNIAPTAAEGESAVIPPESGWDGTHRGKVLNTGVFVYFAEVEFFDGTVQVLKGDVTLR